MIHKYTTDGKKVVVVGKLNATETIVQEIFVKQDGSEIPSGEQFVTKSLHDEPVVTWQEKRNKEIKASIARWEAQLEETSNRVRNEQAKAAARIKALSVFATAATRESFAMLEAFASGRIKYVVADRQYGNCRILLFTEELVVRADYGRFEDDLRLLSLFGRADGSFVWRIHRYSDGSGCGEKDILPAADLEEARAIAQRVFNKKVDQWRAGKIDYAPQPTSYLDIDGKPMQSLVVPEDVIAYHAKQKADAKAELIAKLKADLAKAEKE